MKRTTTTLARRGRLDEILATFRGKKATVPSLVEILRDHQCENGVACELGDRRLIDAFIATHGFVADATAKTLWVSAGPHLSGAFVRFDLEEIFREGYDPATTMAKGEIAADAILGTPLFEAGRARAGGPKFGGDAR